MTTAAAPRFGCTCARLRKLTRRVTRVYDARLAALGLRATQFSLLVNAAAGARPLSELAAAMEMDRTTLTRSLRPLVAHGWIRVATGDDPRTRLVGLTAAGRRKLDAARPAWQAAQREIETTLGEAFVGGLHDQLEHALAALASLPQRGAGA